MGFDGSGPTASDGSFVHRAVDWVLLDGNRLLVAGLALAAALAVFLAVEPFRALSSGNVTPVLYTFSAMIGGNLNLLTIVVMINQLVLSRELRTPRKFRKDVEGVGEFRADVADAIGDDVAPITPGRFASDLVGQLEEQAAAVEAIAEERTDRRLVGELGALEDSLTDDLAGIRAALEEESPAAHDVVIALLDVDFAGLTHRTDRLGTEFEGDLSEAELATLDRLATQVELLDVTRDRFKQFFTRQSLADMSRLVLVVGAIAEVVLAVVLLTFVGLLGGVETYLTPSVVYVAAVVGLAPLAVVFAYIMRAATIARRTATTTQFATGSEHL